MYLVHGGCTCLVPGGTYLVQGGGGVPAWSGGVPAWSGGVPGPGDVPAWSGGCTCLVPGGVPACSRGGTWSGILAHASEIITLAKTSFRPVKKYFAAPSPDLGRAPLGKS